MTVDIIVAKPSQSLVPLLPAKRRTNLKDMRLYQNIEGFLSVEYVVSIFDLIHSTSQFYNARPPSDEDRFLVIRHGGGRIHIGL